MNPSTQDLVHGIDITGINPVTGGDFNSLVDQAYPGPDVGLTITTQDTALNTPLVPDAFSVPKWQKYLWLRVPYYDPSPTATTNVFVAKLYTWSPNLQTSDSVYQQWIDVGINVEGLQTQIDNINIQLGSLQTSINTALTEASEALALAQSLETRVFNLENEVYNIGNEISSINNTLIDYGKRITNIENWIDNNFPAGTLPLKPGGGSNTPQDPATVLTPGLPDQFLHTSYSGINPKPEWQTLADRMGLFTYETPGDGLNFTIDPNSRPNNAPLSNVYMTSNAATLYSLSGGIVTIKVSGIYKFHGICHYNGVFYAQSALTQISGSTTTIYSGISKYISAGTASDSAVSALFSCISGDTVALTIYVKNAGSTSNFGQSSLAGISNCYAQLMIEKVG